MSEHFEKVKGYLLDLGYSIEREVPDQQVLVVNDEAKGIRNLVLACDDPILVLEQLILPLPQAPAETYRRLLQMNRGLVHGALVLNEGGDKLLFRDTLELEHLDRNELEAALNALSLGLAEFGDELLSFRN